MLPKLKLRNCIILLIGSIIQAIGIYNIHAVSSVTEGGVLGLTLLLKHWLDLSPALSSFVLNLICYMIGWRTLGKEFIGYSLISICIYSVSYGICEQFPPFWPEIASFPLAAAVLGALFIGVGAGLCVRAGGATAGDDALAMSFSHILKIPIQWVYLACDLAVLLLSLSYIPLRRITWSLLTVILSGQIIGIIQKINVKERLE